MSYLQVVFSYKNYKFWKLVVWIFWFFSLDDVNGIIVGGFDDFKGDIYVWWWIMFVLQFFNGILYKEVLRVFVIFIKIVKMFFQVFYFQFCISKEDYFVIKKVQENKV